MGFPGHLQRNAERNEATEFIVSTQEGRKKSSVDLFGNPFGSILTTNWEVISASVFSPKQRQRNFLLLFQVPSSSSTPCWDPILPIFPPPASSDLGDAMDGCRETYLTMKPTLVFVVLCLWANSEPEASVFISKQSFISVLFTDCSVCHSHSTNCKLELIFDIGFTLRAIRITVFLY